VGSSSSGGGGGRTVAGGPLRQSLAPAAAVTAASRSTFSPQDMPLALQPFPSGRSGRRLLTHFLWHTYACVSC
jgi:hypothetical protein